MYFFQKKNVSLYTVTQFEKLAVLTSTILIIPISLEKRMITPHYKYKSFYRLWGSLRLMDTTFILSDWAIVVLIWIPTGYFTALLCTIIRGTNVTHIVTYIYFGCRPLFLFREDIFKTNGRWRINEVMCMSGVKNQCDECYEVMRCLVTFWYQLRLKINL